MSDRPDETLPISRLRHIDRASDQLEAALKAGEKVSVDDFLGDAKEPERSELREELKAVLDRFQKSAKKKGKPARPAKDPGMAKFVRTLVESRLMTDDEVQEFLDALPEDEEPHSAEDLAKALYRHKRLTRFQTQAVFQGRTKGLVLGKYEVLDKIGQGGMGHVYKARHKRMRREVALKVLPTAVSRDKEAILRFHREVMAAAQLDHPNIVAAYDADDDNGVHFLVMQHVDGLDLHKLVRTRGTVTVGKALSYITQAAKGLEYAHSKGLIHRDIKPPNLLLDRDGTVKILDMGLARFEREIEEAGAAGSLTQTGQVMGTLDYMAPEQAMDTHAADARADVYSLGCTLYYLLTGEPVYAGGTMASKFVAHREHPIPSLRAGRDDVPEGLDAVFQRMLAKRPEDRQQSMTELLVELESCCSERDEFAETVSFAGGAAGVDTAAPEAIAKETGSGDSALEAWLHAKPESASTLFHLNPRKENAANKQRLIYNLVAAGVAFLALVLTITLIIRTPKGTLIVEVNEPGAKIEVDDGQVTITTPDDKEPVTVRVAEGEHTLKVSKGGFETFTERFTIKSRGKEIISVELKRPAVAKASKPPAPPPTEPAVAEDTVPTPPAQPTTPPPQAPEPTETLERGLGGILPRPVEVSGLGRWQVETMTPRGCPFPGNSSIAWSPDGKFIGYGTFEGTVRIYDAATLKLVQLLVGHVGAVQSVSWNPDGQRIATGGVDKTVRVFGADGTPVRVLHGHDDDVECVAWSRDGRHLASGSRDMSVRLWDADGTPGTVLRGHSRTVCTVAWSPDSRRIASSGEDGTVRLWETDGTPGPILKGHSGSVWSVAWSPDGRWIASGSHDSTVRIWNDDGTPGPVLREHTDVVISVAWSPDSQRLATAGYDRTIRLWNADGTPHSVLTEMDRVKGVAWSPSGDRIASVDRDGDLRIWEASGESGPVLERHLVTMGRWSRNRRRIASSGKGNTLQIWSSSGALERVLRGHAGPPLTMAWNADGTRIASGDEDGVVRIWEADGTPGPVLEGHKSRIMSLAWSPDGESLASCGWDKTIRLWNVDGTPGPVLRGGKPVSLAWSPDGRWLASGGWDKTIQLWEVDGTLGPALRGHGAAIRHLAWSPDGQWLASAGTGIRIWSARGEPGPVLQGNEEGTWPVAWSPDGRRLASAGSENTLRLWGVDGTSGPVLGGLTGSVDSFAWSLDGLHVVSSGASGTIVSWDVDAAGPERVMLLFNDGASVELDAGGDVLHGDPEVIERELIYLIETPSGAVDVLKPSEFEERVAEAKLRQSPPLAIAPFDAPGAKKHQQAWADYLGVPVESKTGIGMKMVLIPPGEFLMGSSEEERIRSFEEAKALGAQWAADWIPGEAPRHRVRISRPFALGRHEVTRGQFRQFVEETGYKTEPERDGNGGHGSLDGKWVQDPRFVWSADPGFPQTDDHPVVEVFWNDAKAFCQWLSKKQGVTYDLPTEAQWEYACRAGTTTAWHCGDSDTTLQEYAWFSGRGTHPVGQLKSNAWGLYDMHGNAREWCADWLATDYYAQSPANDPSGPTAGSLRVIRGGGWEHHAGACRSAFRLRGPPRYADYNVGFRVATVLADE